MSNLMNTSPVRDHEADREFTRLEEGIKIRPIIETEWSFSLHAYGETPTDVLRPIRSYSMINGMNRVGAAGLVIHSLSIIRNIPEQQNEDWKPRAQIDMNVRGLVKDGIVIENIEEHMPLVWSKN